MSKWIKKGDKVIVICGNDKGKIGEVLARVTSEDEIEKGGKLISNPGDRVIVRGVNVRKKHMKRTSESNPGGIVEMETAIHISNVNICSSEGKPVHLKARIVNGVKELYYKDGLKEVVHRQI